MGNIRHAISGRRATWAALIWAALGILGGPAAVEAAGEGPLKSGAPAVVAAPGVIPDLEPTAVGARTRAGRPRSKRDPALGTAGLDEETSGRPSAPRAGKIAGLVPTAAARFEGMATPGVQIRLLGDGSTGLGLRYRWIQTQGTPVELIDPTQATARVTVPEGARTLGFQLVVSNDSGMDAISLTVPVEGQPRVPADGEPRADAGDDQIGLVGRQITLNGGRSEPHDKLAYRWIQVGGPQVRLKIEQGPIFSFVPTEAGTHRFVLVVATTGMISEPDEVQIAIDYSASKAARPVPFNEARPSSTLPSPPPNPELLSQFVRSTLVGLEVGPAAADSMAQTFDGVAGRIGLFRCYDETFSEVSRRLDAVVPQETASRSLWIERFFGPITSKLVEEMRKEGLDLSAASGRAAPLTEGQRSRLAEVFRAIAEGSRAASRSM